MIETYKLYKGEVTLTFDPVKHFYAANGEPVESVTGILKVVDKSGPLMYWAVSQAMGHIESHIKAGVPMDEVEIKTLISEASKQHRIRRDSAADLGTLAHDWIDGYIKAKIAKAKVPGMPVNKALKGIVEAFMGWEKEHKVKFLGAERKIYSQKFKFAGTLDFDAIVDGQLSIGDNKTSKGIYSTMRYQTAGYKLAYEEETGEDVKDRWIIRLGKDGSDFEFAKLPAKDYPKDRMAFLAAQALARREKELAKNNGYKD